MCGGTREYERYHELWGGRFRRSFWLRGTLAPALARSSPLLKDCPRIQRLHQTLHPSAANP